MNHRIVTEEMAGETVGAVLRTMVEGLSWSGAKKLIAGRRVLVNDIVVLNDARRLVAGDRLELAGEAKGMAVRERQVRLVHIDGDLVVVEKPAGVLSHRPGAEEGMSEERKELELSLDELVGRMLAPPGGKRLGKPRRGKELRVKALPVYVVHRLDRDTSGLMMFALTAKAREALVKLFAGHVIERTYTAVCAGVMKEPMTIESHLVRDRGDGLRGSGGKEGKRAVTHVRPLEVIDEKYTVLECRLETGRTHQIRIHLAEKGFVLCGEKIYTHPDVADLSGAPRQALHSTTLAFTHPVTGKNMRFTSEMPSDLAEWLKKLR